MKMKMFTTLFLLALVAIMPSSRFASYSDTTVSFSQSINTGTLSTQILTENGQAVQTPNINLGSKAFSYTCQTDSTASLGNLGTNTERLYVSNPAYANNGFTLTIAATNGSSAKWENTLSGNSYDFNDVASTGCEDGVDNDSISGKLSIDPSVGTLFTDCATCNMNGMLKGTAASFDSGTVDSITLLMADSNSNNIWRGYITGIALSQSIPAEQLADSYTMNFTITATAS